MIDPLMRRTTAISRAVNRMQSAQILSLSRELVYATFTNSVDQFALSNARTFLVWGYTIHNSTEENGISSPFDWDAGGSVITIPRQGYYLFNLGLVFSEVTPTIVITELYVNDVMAQRTQQPSSGYSNLNETINVSFSLFAEEGDSIQLAIITNSLTVILSAFPVSDSETIYGFSPILHIVKLV